MEQITIPSSVHHLGKHIFSGCRSLKTLTVPFPACGTPATFSNFGELFGTTPDIEMRKISQDNETGKETNYYLPHSLSVLRILEGCEIIPSKCLMNCFVLKELHLPSSLYMMGEKAVYGCAGLKTIYCQAAEPASIHADTFGGIRFNVCRIHVPQGSTEKYKQDKHWKPFSLIEE
ncbi:leucine-rich repeat protein [Paraprevotella clara]|uniref:leucine-rich repeat protein n=1 Tax=Paraprevotella clara TaxID=454154 RepID=UPI00307C482B